MTAGPIVLGAAGLLSALALGAFQSAILLPMASAAAGRPVAADLHLIPTSINAPLLLSLLTVAIGLVVYLALTPLRRTVDAVLRSVGLSADRGFDHVISALLGLASGIIRVVQPGRLELYILMMVAATAAVLITPMIMLGEAPGLPDLVMPRLKEAAVMAIALLGLVAVIVARTRLTAIVSLGIQGFAVAMLFVLFGAPDLAFTQFMVETLSVVILALVLTRLSLGERDHRPAGQMVLDGVLATAAGGALAALLLKVSQVPFDRTLTDFYDQYSRVIAHGRNVVNVIIVDFRGLDTLGEISVVMITGLAILALVKVKARGTILPGPAKEPPR